ncbi:hypothetical protein [Halanaeroarchaeum sulfurireducens]|uniref:Uncharacterized protein n=1 Tax=Halanaeroarchaeum sulfurireducens TaxID=1604004 RepID=A0A0F7PCP2_9EURY|nr:hypothetical protein [Halanaeroarchaeum sulfurireducens]AKH97414.1 hypothetical protein HLASF_0923 [Halanaeroarchaeum sulfurireducens]ALG81810.1 hypothetical protein HLASA_0913 [Halanaeroarchaeum sulfurireducens]
MNCSYTLADIPDSLAEIDFDVDGQRLECITEGHGIVIESRIQERFDVVRGDSSAPVSLGRTRLVVR